MYSKCTTYMFDKKVYEHHLFWLSSVCEQYLLLLFAFHASLSSTLSQTQNASASRSVRTLEICWLLNWFRLTVDYKARFTFKRNRLCCVCCVNENRKKRTSSLVHRRNTKTRISDKRRHIQGQKSRSQGHVTLLIAVGRYDENETS